MSRRKLGSSLSEPINRITEEDYDSACLIEKDKASALKTRAAALMYMRRHGLDYTTSVKNDRVYIYQDKDIQMATLICDLR